MKRVFTLLVICSLFSCVKAKSNFSTGIQKPNFVFILADDCTFRDLGCYGGQAHTPNIDQLAKDGMKFNYAFQAAPMCSPTRHTICTGLYPVKSGAYPNHTRAYNKVESIVHYLKLLGYRVAMSGKTHVSPKSVFPFEYSKGIADLFKGKGAVSKKKNSRNFAVIDKLMSESKANKNPFCLFVTSNQPHTPWDLGDPSRYPPEKIKLASYYVDTKETREGSEGGGSFCKS